MTRHEPNKWPTYRRLNTLGPTIFCMFTTHIFLYENKLHTTSKGPSTRPYLPHMETKALRSRALTPNLLHKESSHIQGISISSTPLYKDQTSSPLGYVKIPSSHTIEFLKII